MPSPSLVLLRTQSDARLVALARDGHERAFEAIVERYRRQLLRSCRRVLPEARAEDSLRIADAPGDEIERRAVMRQTLQGLASLPPRQREALLAIAIEGRSQDEVAGELGLSPGAVRQLVHRARSSLRAAATAVVPLPLVSWAAGLGPRGDLAARVAELSAGAGGAGAAAALAKAGTVAVIAGGVVAGPALVEKRTHGPQAPAAAIAAPPAVREGARAPTGTPDARAP